MVNFYKYAFYIYQGISLHPGWVRTDMGGPNALISVDESINGMMSVISNTNIKNSGQFLNYDGSEIPW